MMGKSVNANACARDKKKDESVNIHVKDVFVNSNLHDTIGCKKDNRFLYNARNGDFFLSDECASERNYRRGRKRRHQTCAHHILRRHPVTYAVPGMVTSLATKGNRRG